VVITQIEETLPADCVDFRNLRASDAGDQRAKISGAKLSLIEAQEISLRISAARQTGPIEADFQADEH